MSASSKAEHDLDALHDDIAALKRDVADLLDHLKSGATAGAQGAADRLGEGAEHLYRDFAAKGEEQIKTLGEKIEKQPLLAVLIAFGIGYLFGRLLSR